MENKFKTGDLVIAYYFENNPHLRLLNSARKYISKAAKVMQIDLEDESAELEFMDGESYWWPLNALAFQDGRKTLDQDIQSLKDKYPQYRFTITVEDNL